MTGSLLTSRCFERLLLAQHVGTWVYIPCLPTVLGFGTSSDSIGVVENGAVDSLPGSLRIQQATT